MRSPVRRPSLRPRIEELALVAGGVVATLASEWAIISDPDVYETDARLHTFWMRRFQDSDVFQDPLTEALLQTGYVPDGVRALYWLASWVADPVRFGEFLPLVLAPLSAWLVFRIVRAHTLWQPAAWLGAALYLLAWDIHRFSGGHARSFAQPIILCAVFLLLQRRPFAAALVPPIGAFFYPPAALCALGVIMLGSLAEAGRPILERRRLILAAASAAALAAALLVPGLLGGGLPDILTRAEARAYLDFGPNGKFPFFVGSREELLEGKLGGFNLNDSGSILAIAALTLLVLRPRNVFLLRWEVWGMAIAALAFFALAHALLFRLYLPTRYTYPLIPFFAIVVAIALRPTWEALAARLPRGIWLPSALLLPAAVAFLAVSLFPLGSELTAEQAGELLGDHLTAVGLATLAVGLVLAVQAWRREALAAGTAAALLAGALLVSGVAVAGGGKSPLSHGCPKVPLLRYLASLPEDAIVAGNPLRLGCVTIVSERAVVMTKKQYQPWDVDYFAVSRERMERLARAYFGGSVQALVDLRSRYGADYLVVDRHISARGWASFEPYTGLVRRLVRTVDRPAAKRLPEACRRWEGEAASVYDLACVAETASA